MMPPYLTDPDVTLHQGDSLEVLRSMPDASVHMACTSPPFFGLRDYGTGTWEGGDGRECSHEPTKQKDRTFKSGAGVDGRNCLSWTERDGSTYGQTCPRCGARRIDSQIGLESSPDEWAARLVGGGRRVGAAALTPR